MSRSKFDFDISVGATKTRRPRGSTMSGAFESSTHQCEWQGCKEKAAYRAPKARDQLNDFHWFCLKHVREYNSKWDYFDGMTSNEIEDRQRAAQTWDRKTQSFGQQKSNTKRNPHAEGEAWRRLGFTDPMEALGQNATINPGEHDQTREARRRLLPKAELKALEVMQLPETATKADIRKRYGELVKALHPDRNQGDRNAEQQLKEVIEANTRLKKSAYFRS